MVEHGEEGGGELKNTTEWVKPRREQEIQRSSMMGMSSFYKRSAG